MRAAAYKVKQASGSDADQTAYLFLLNTISNTFDDVFDDSLVVSGGLVVPEAHESPLLLHRIPMHFDNAVVQLFAGPLQTTATRQFAYYQQVAPDSTFPIRRLRRA